MGDACGLGASVPVRSVLLVVVCYNDTRDDTDDDKDDDEGDEETNPSLLPRCTRGVHGLFGMLDTG